MPRRTPTRPCTWLFLLITLALLLVACRASPRITSNLDEPAMPAQTTPATLPPAAESQQPVRFGTPGPPPDGWQRHQSADWQVSFDVPADWIEEEADHFAGADGFARLEPYAGPGMAVDQACEWEANVHRERYGQVPGLVTLPRGNAIDFESSPCLILDGQGGVGDVQSAILLPNPAGGQETWFLILSVDTAHAPAIAQSISYQQPVQPRPTLPVHSYQATPQPEDVPAELPMQTTRFGELTLEEYTIVDATLDGPGRFDFYQRIPPTVLEKRRAWRETDSGQGHLAPVNVGGKQITVREVSYEPGVVGYQPQPRQVLVQEDGKEVYQHYMLSHAAVFPLYYLGNWDGQWVMEANGLLVVDGQIVNQEWGYDEIFGCQLLNGKPFYFFVQDGQTHLAYGGEVLPVTYEYVYHGMCCEPGAFNVAGNDQMVCFYALEDGVWHYIELGVYR
jgi:hypothetical protein